MYNAEQAVVSLISDIFVAEYWHVARVLQEGQDCSRSELALSSFYFALVDRLATDWILVALH